MNYEELLGAVTKALDYTKRQEPSVRMETELSALRTVVELHKPIKEGYTGWGFPGDCNECEVNYPCPTIQAIEEQLNRQF